MTYIKDRGVDYTPVGEKSLYWISILRNKPDKKSKGFSLNGGRLWTPVEVTLFSLSKAGFPHETLHRRRHRKTRDIDVSVERFVGEGEVECGHELRVDQVAGAVKHQTSKSIKSQRDFYL